MTAQIEFEFAPAWAFAGPLMAGLVWVLWKERTKGASLSRVAALGTLRLAALLPLLFLAARPVWVVREKKEGMPRPVVILMDRSESMSLEENGATRYEQ